MPKKINTDHVVLSRVGGNSIECRHCGAQLRYELPMLISDWLTMSRGFMKNHKRCHPKESVSLVVKEYVSR